MQRALDRVTATESARCDRARSRRQPDASADERLRQHRQEDTDAREGPLPCRQRDQDVRRHRRPPARRRGKARTRRHGQAVAARARAKRRAHHGPRVAQPHERPLRRCPTIRDSSRVSSGSSASTCSAPQKYRSPPTSPSPVSWRGRRRVAFHERHRRRRRACARARRAPDRAASADP
jgi:hypothetical protein